MMDPVENDWDDSVSMRLACLALHKGRLTDDLVTALAVRGTLLIDLALRGRLTQLIADGASSLAEWLRCGPVDQYDLAAEHLRRGSWTLKRRLLLRRYEDHRTDRTIEDRRAMESPPGRDWKPTDAALVAIASVLGLARTGRSLPTESLLEATVDVRWLTEFVVDEVNQRVVLGRAVRWATS
jgi:hypothetical protein